MKRTRICQNQSSNPARTHAARGQAPLCPLNPSIAQAALLAGIAVIAISTIALESPAQPAAPAAPSPPAQTPRSTLPLADPVIDADAKLYGQRVHAWTDKGVSHLLLEGNVKIEVNGYGFRAQRAAVRIDTEIAAGRRVRHVSMYLVDAKPLANAGPITAEAGRLFVTASIRGKVDVGADLWKDESAASDPLVLDGEARLARYMAMISAPTLTLPPGAADPRPRPVPPPIVEAPATPPKPPGIAPAKGDGVAGRAIAPPDGVVSFNADKFVFDKGTGGESTVSLIGKVRLIYQDSEGETRLTLRAENAVIFLGNVDASALAGNQAKSADVRAIYLEENVVASDGDYTLRAPRVFYDFQQNKALVLQAVLYAWDIKRQLPLYVRAEKIQQESGKLWTAHRALVTTSEFAEPHVAIAADKITFKQEERPDGTVANLFRAEDLSVRVGQLPVYVSPAAAGEGGQLLPLRDFDVRYNSNTGAEVRTRWDMFSLLGREAPAGVDLTGNIDYRGDHGPAVGLNLEYDRPDHWGFFDGYMAFYDSGEDELGDRRRVDHDGDFRGFAHGFHRQKLRDNWELSIEGAYVSDPSFLEEYFPGQAEFTKQYETSLYLKKQEDDWAFTFLASGTLNDFQAQTADLQAPGYFVDKLPEVAWRQIGVPLFDNRLTYYHDTRVSRMRIHGGRDKPSDRGFNDAASLAVFGITAETEYHDALHEAGIATDFRNRIDSRHEVQAPMKWSIFNVTPYVSGRVTAYDDDFEEFAGETDQVRLFGVAGIRVATQFSKVYSDVDDRIFDLHKMRHIIEPSLDVSLAGSTYNPEDIPVFDADVEALSEGATIRLGLRNTLQTQRGGEGRWRNVDWLTLDTDLILRSDDADVDTPLPHYYAYRPEYTTGGDHFHTRMAWMISDSLAAIGELDWSLENDDLAQWHVGLQYQHGEHMTWSVDYAQIEPLDSKLIGWGFTYRLTTKYDLAFRHTIDLQDNNDRQIDVMLVRKLPRWRLAVIFSHDEIDDEQTVAVMLIPDGIRAGRLDRPFRPWGE